MTDKKDIYNNLKDDEKELDELFENTGADKLKRLIRKAKWHSILRTAVISVIAMGLILIGGIVVDRHITQSMEGPLQVAVDRFNNISDPNQYIGKVNRYHGFLGGKNIYSTYKLIEGKLVYTGQDEYEYGLLRIDEGDWIGSNSPGILGYTWDEKDLNLRKYNQLGQREMVFFYPFNDYSTYRNDLELLEDIGPNKYMEMALSFDKLYSFDEVNEMLPEGVTLAWYWVDDLNEDEKGKRKPDKKKQKHPDGKTYIVDYPAKVISEGKAYGIKAYGENGEPIEKPVEMFLNSIKNGRRDKDDLMGDDYRVAAYGAEFERLYNNLVGKDGKLTKEDIKVQGVVVTGDAESLKSLRGLPFIKASSLGVVTDKY